ncbi:MAG: M23 family metallopeptidase [Alphaproteobacteria bacterium]|nr:M23 family metallopeptidase [Alphaproteobacteria bacterium]MBU1515468.1 M23 family metallopeptidase [Alphaproteobacteria bacterium]MBU2095466.1 M23 family metallopeptidase [Alphaproteobacteria bacterium]MBU2306972.1 M23 family metallopeptidase [Alphaproteobacteria bacterium]MBU2362197.1 M23 family metallopeptidase [Alphaproteobacteria bacterium]
MQIFKPGKFPIRLASGLAAGTVAICAGLIGWQVAARLDKADAVVLAPEAAAALQHAAFTQAEAQPGYARPRNVALEVRPGETLERAVQRAGVTAAEARQAVDALGRAMDTVNIKAGLDFDAAVAQPRGDDRPARLIGLSLRTGPASAVTLSRTFDGALRLRALEEKVTAETTVADGEIHGSLYESAQRLGATPAITAQVAKLFAHKLDFQRDIQPGDDFRLVFDRKVTESGRTIETGDLEYAELHGVKFFRFERDGGDAEYFDEDGKNIRGFLLRTPVDGARLTSGFGKRRHPILGYARAHQGVDFGAGSGTPVLAAGDGVVVKAGRWGGYGNWLQIRHANGLDTGYAHLSRYAKGLRPGMKVRQGQVVAFVGTTGMSTGPHLHYEVWQRGRRVNPVGAKVPQGTVLAGAELTRFRAEKGRLERLLADGGSPVKLAAAE